MEPIALLQPTQKKKNHFCSDTVKTDVPALNKAFGGIATSQKLSRKNTLPHYFNSTYAFEFE